MKFYDMSHFVRSKGKKTVQRAHCAVERESKELNALQEDLARHMGKKPKNAWVARPMQQVSIFGDVVIQELDSNLHQSDRYRLKALVTWNLAHYVLPYVPTYP